MADDNVPNEAEAIAYQYALRKPDHNDVLDADWEAASDETKNLLIRVQQLAKTLGEAYCEAERQIDRERQALLHERKSSRPHLSGISPEFNFKSVCIERETEFMVRAKLWIRDIEELLKPKY